MSVKYINDSIENGVEYNWEQIIKDFKRLKCPKTVWTPTELPFDKCNWFTLFSRRETGKTTNILLLVLLMYKSYGTIGEYIRQTDDMLKPSALATLFKTIVNNGYIEKITNNEYDNVYYYGKRFYLCKYEGVERKPKKIDSNAFMYCHSIDEAMSMKSTYNSPMGDLIILDEFEGKTYKENEWLYFHHIISTIRRGRLSTKVILLGNTISPHCYYFREMGIDNIVETMQPHDIKLHTTKRGTPIYIEYVEPLQTKQDSEQHKLNVNLYHGWENLNSIVGGGWDLYNYPHITKEIRKESKIITQWFIDYQGMLFKMSYVYSKKYGYNIFVEPTEQIRNNTITFVKGRELQNKNEVYHLGFTLKHRKIWEFFKMKRMLFSTNNVGDIIEQFIKE